MVDKGLIFAIDCSEAEAMALPDKNVLIGLVIGAMSATMLGGIGPGMVYNAFADESVTALDPSKLVKFKDRLYEVSYEDSVSTTPVSSSTIRKIEYGRTSFVDIATTATGTYSSEALYSPHIRYPGILVKPVSDSHDGPNRAFSFWRSGAGWVSMSVSSASSIVNVRTRDSRVHVHDGATCVATRNYSTCN